LKGLSKKIPFLCFEFVKDFPLQIKKCLERILSIGSAKFNFTLDKNYGFYYRNWVDYSQIYKNLIAIDNPQLCGDIYVKFI